MKSVLSDKASLNPMIFNLWKIGHGSEKAFLD